ncbi:MAG: riboflavin synthase [Desulfuromonadales bacterium]|nr:riboflavin synthase [Desulfuromonadales bacterium]
MFTGLIEDVGTVRALQRDPRQATLTVATSLPTAELRLGDSVAVNGVCLTLTAIGVTDFSVDVSPESLDATTLGRLEAETPVNLERALRLADRLGGHLVTGHVDSQGVLLERRQEGNAWRLRYGIDRELSKLLVAKGSVAIDGISLTVNDVGDDFFTVAVIPHTLRATTLDGQRVGARVNLETDIIGKYVARLLGREPATVASSVTVELLAKHGFL